MASSESKPTPSEPEAGNTLAKSFEDRLTFPTETPKSNGTNPGASSFTPSSKFDWADEATTPVQDSGEKSASEEKQDPKTETSSVPKDESSLEMAQGDGATTWMNGSSGLDEPEFDVNVKLADLQDDPNNPLYSVKDFGELNL